MPTPRALPSAGRAPRIVAFLLAVTMTAAAAPVLGEITPDAAKVVGRYLDALGGPEVVRAVQSTHVKASIEAFGLKGPTEVWARVPDQRATRTEIGPFKLLGGYDGHTAWRTDPSGKVATLDGKDLDEARSEGYFENDQWLMPDQRGGGGGKVAKVAEAEAGKEWVVLEVTPPAGRPRRLWFDAKTGLLGKAVSKSHQQTVTTLFSDYRAVP